ncbi:MAG: spermidine/putrescine ABC transporter substrate-binding protein [Chloroflexi bacterium]|nr:spermidine/putrescine ABC transporter substrate-binding protein [Chloroflexota bacterium]
MPPDHALKLMLVACMVSVLASCGAAVPTPNPVPSWAHELMFYDWDSDMPRSVLDAFTAEYGVPVKYLTYESSEAAVDAIKSGMVLDVVVMEARLVPLLIDGGWLAKLDYRNIANFKNVSANFRDLSYDPKNAHSVPFNWGTTGLVVRSDLVASPVSRWSDLWDPRYAGAVGIWRGQQRDVMSMTLKSLGYSANSEDPDELDAVLRRLLALKPHCIFIDDFDPSTSARLLADGRLIIAMGYATDALQGRKLNTAITYVMPSEGTAMWGDNFVIPAASKNQTTAELFLNFLLRPEISAQIINANFYPMPNDAAIPYIAPEIRNDPAVFPPSDLLKRAEIIMPLSPEGQALHDDIWARFLAGGR